MGKNYVRKFKLKNKSFLKMENFFLNKGSNQILRSKNIFCFDILHLFQKKKIVKQCFVCTKTNFSWERFISKCQGNYHRFDHPCLTVFPTYIPIFSYDWSFEEETMLLRSIETFGCSNWHTISSFIRTKSALDCEYHYYWLYIEYGIKNHQKNWRLFSRIFFLKESLSYWQEFLMVRCSKSEKNFSWISQKGEFFCESENNFEDLLPHLLIKKIECDHRKKTSDILFLAEYNRKLFHREIRRKAYCENNFSMENRKSKIFTKKTFYEIYEKFQERINAKKKKKILCFWKKKKNKKKGKKIFFLVWLNNCGFEKKNFLSVISNFNFFSVVTFPHGKYSKNKLLVLTEKYFFYNSKKVFLGKDLLTKKEKIFCLYTGLFPLQFLMYKSFFFLKRFGIANNKCEFDFLNSFEMKIFFLICEYIILGFPGIYRFSKKKKNLKLHKTII